MTVSALANIDVDDLARAIDFYCSALELTVGRRFGSSAVELVGASVARSAPERLRHARHAGFFAAAWIR